MSTPPFFEPAGRGDLKFWSTAEGPTVVIWESLLKSGKTSWSEKMSTSKTGSCGVIQKTRGKDRPFELRGGKIFSPYDEKKLKANGKKSKKGTKASRGQSVRSGHGGNKTT